MANKKYTIVHHNDLKDEKHILIEDLDKFIEMGYVEGISKEHKDRISKGKKGKGKGRKTPEHVKKKISVSVSKAKKGKKHSPERRKSNSEAQKKCRWYTNGTKEKRCFPCNKPEGWWPGRLPFSDETRINQSKAHKGKRLTPEQLEIRTDKEWETKMKNGTLKYSKPEELLYEFLVRENPNKHILRQYKDKKRYPFHCDFYIVEDDLFIELNAHWVHGGKPYDFNDLECQEKLNFWKEKAKISQYYERAIEIWTVSDVKKARVAQENKINYKVIYDIYDIIY